MTALKVHVSSATYEELNRTTEYILEKRGQVDVKVCAVLLRAHVSGKCTPFLRKSCVKLLLSELRQISIHFNNSL